MYSLNLFNCVLIFLTVILNLVVYGLLKLRCRKKGSKKNKNFCKKIFYLFYSVNSYIGNSFFGICISNSKRIRFSNILRSSLKTFFYKFLKNRFKILYAVQTAVKSNFCHIYLLQKVIIL